VEDDKEVDQSMISKEKERERQRAMHNLEPRELSKPSYDSILS
jgi:hypothetical protein